MRFRARKSGLSPTPVVFPSDRSQAVPLLHFFFVCVSVVLHVPFILSLFEPYLSFFLDLGFAALPVYLLYLFFFL